MNVTMYTLNNWILTFIYLHKVLFVRDHDHRCWITLVLLRAERKPDRVTRVTRVGHSKSDADATEE